MTRALNRRSRRLLGIANDRLGESKWTIWCYEPEKMPAMIDLLIARGAVSESDRPHCIHWSALRGADPLTQDDVDRILDADAMLEEAGIRTLIRELPCDPEAEETLSGELSGEASADDLEALRRGGE